jgi:hypothetical protein
MNNNKILLFFTLCLFIISTACSVEKRIHTTGYHVDWSSTPSRLQQKEITLTKKHKSFNHFELSGPVCQEKTKPISVLNAGVLETVENKPKTIKATINNLIAFAKTAKIKTRGEIKPNTIEQDAKSPVDPEAKYDASAIASFILGLASLFLIIITPAVALALYILALVFGIIALVKMSENPRLKGRGLAIAGMVILPLGVLLGLIILILLFASYLSGGG